MDERKWELKIIRVCNGYYLYSPSTMEDVPNVEIVIEDSDTDELKSHEELLWFIMDHFAFQGSKHDKERLRVIREKNEEHCDSS